MAPKIECGVPISLWLVGNGHRTKFVVEFLLFRFIPYQRGAGPEERGGGLLGHQSVSLSLKRVRVVLRGGEKLRK